MALVTHQSLVPFRLLLTLTTTKLHMVFGADGHDARPNFTYCGERVGRECLCALLGIGVNRLRKAFNMVPDLRVGKDKSGSHENTFSVDAFLSMLHNNVAETLPDRPLDFKLKCRAKGFNFWRPLAVLLNA